MSEIKKIVICIILPDFNLMDRYSAVASVVYSIADLLRKDGYEIFVNEKSIEQWENEVESTTTIYMPITRFGFIKYFPKRLRELIKDLLYFRKNKKLYQTISVMDKPDLVLSWITIGNSYNVDLAKKWSVPLVSIYDNPLVEEYTFLKGFPPFFKGLVNKHEKKALAHSESVIAYSEAVKNHIQKTHQVAAKFYFKAFTDFKRMHYLNVKRDSKEINFVYVGSFFNWHKIDDLIEAFRTVSKEHHNCKLYLIGDGPEFNRIQQLVKDPNIVLTGRLDGRELEGLMEKMHVGVISNALWFQAPVKLFQYSAAQLAVISKRTPTIVELTGNKECYAFFDNVKELEKQMSLLLRNPELIQTMKTGAQMHIKENYSEYAYTLFFRQIFETLH